MLKTLSTRLLGLLPNACLLCQDPCRWLLCPACQDDLPDNGAGCQQCALPLPQPGLCPACLARPPAFDRCIAALSYQGPAAGLIRRWKHGTDGRALLLLAGLLHRQLLDAYCQDDLPELLLPVPLHPLRQARRGFHQTWQLASALSARLALPVTADGLVRTGRAHSQQGLDRKDRLKNLVGQFALRKPLAARHLALVDDVMTTGATAAVLAKLLKDHGASRVDVWLIARTP